MSGTAGKDPVTGRNARLAAALRANLRRRKAQERDVRGLVPDSVPESADGETQQPRADRDER